MASESFEAEVAEPVTPAGSGSGTSKKTKDLELERFMSRLTDQSFNMKKYPDPLARRRGVHPRFFPGGVTLAMEKTWMDRIKEVKDAAT